MALDELRIIRLCELADHEQHAALEGVVALQRRVWGFPLKEAVPSHTLKAAERCGGVVLMAMDAGDLAGFCFSLPAWDHEGRYHYIHMIGTDPGYQERGVAFGLARRHLALSTAMGLGRAEWTYDPLEPANAHLYIRKLGATVRGPYLVAEYLPTKTGRNRGLPADRVRARGDFQEARAMGPKGPRTLSEIPLAMIQKCSALVLSADTAHGLPRPGDPELGNLPAVFVEVPADFQHIKDCDPRLAMAWRLRTRAALSHYLELGLIISDYLSFKASGERRNFYFLGQTGTEARDAV